jgi:hypothetical protein
VDSLHIQLLTPELALHATRELGTFRIAEGVTREEQWWPSSQRLCFRAWH